MTCGRWDCPAPGCGGLKRMAAREVFAGGCSAAWERDQIVRLMTFTAPPGGMSRREVYLGLKRVKGVLKYHGLLDEYAGVVELQERGAPHLHLMTTGEFIPQSRLSTIARGRPGSEGRFGPIVDIRAVRSTGPRSATEYLLKQVGNEMADYVTKAKAGEHRRLRGISPFKAERLRPVRLSRGWYPGGLAEAGRKVKAEWSAGAEPVAATDWRIWRVNHNTGEPSPLNAPVRPAEAVTPSGLALVTDSGPVLLQAA